MSLGDDQHLRRYVQRCDSPYEVVQCIAELSRGRMAEANYKLRASAAITQVVQGKEPRPYTRESHDTITPYERSYIDDQMCYVDDPQVEVSVRKSFELTRASKQETFVYVDLNLDGDSGRRARVRVLTRLLYHKLIP